MEDWKKTALALGAIATVGIGCYFAVKALARPKYPPELIEEFRRMGDVNRDGIINDKDIALIREAYGSYPGHERWNADADLNGDGIIDLFDLVTATKNYGLTIEEWSKTKGYRKEHTLIKEI